MNNRLSDIFLRTRNTKHGPQRMERRTYQQVSAQSKDWSSVQTELHAQAIWEGMPERGLVTTTKSPLKRYSNWKSQVLFTKKKKKKISPSAPNHAALALENHGGGDTWETGNSFISSYCFDVKDGGHWTQEQWSLSCVQSHTEPLELSAHSSWKEPGSKYLDFTGHMTTVTTFQLGYCSMKTERICNK